MSGLKTSAVPGVSDYQEIVPGLFCLRGDRQNACFKSHCQSRLYHKCEGSPQSGQSSRKGRWVEGGAIYESWEINLYIHREL